MKKSPKFDNCIPLSLDSYVQNSKELKVTAAEHNQDCFAEENIEHGSEKYKDSEVLVKKQSFSMEQVLITNIRAGVTEIQNIEQSVSSHQVNPDSNREVTGNKTEFCFQLGLKEQCSPIELMTVSNVKGEKSKVTENVDLNDKFEINNNQQRFIIVKEEVTSENEMDVHEKLGIFGFDHYFSTQLESELVKKEITENDIKVKEEFKIPNNMYVCGQQVITKIKEEITPANKTDMQDQLDIQKTELSVTNQEEIAADVKKEISDSETDLPREFEIQNETFVKHRVSENSTKRKLSCDSGGKISNKKSKLINNLNKNEYNFKCKFCAKTFHYYSTFINHSRVHFIGKMFKPEFIAQPVNSNENVTELQNHEEPERDKHKVFECDFCEKTFKFKKGFDRHINYHTKEKEFKCEFCKRIYYRKDRLTKHLKTHNDDFKCEFCKRNFDRKDMFLEHMKLHTNVKELKCEFCYEIFYQIDQLTKHLKIHSEKKELKCEFCSSNFTKISHLKRHVNIHTKEKEFKCEICKNEKIFYRKDKLINHLRTKHAIENCYPANKNTEYKCEICDRTFKIKYSLDLHINSHEKKNEYKCDICKKHFSRKDVLNRHLKSHQKNEYKCDICEKQFYRKDTFTRHLNSHKKNEYMCDICEKEFYRKDKLTRHLKSHGHKKNQANFVTIQETDNHA